MHGSGNKTCFLGALKNPLQTYDKHKKITTGVLLERRTESQELNILLESRSVLGCSAGGRVCGAEVFRGYPVSLFQSNLTHPQSTPLQKVSFSIRPMRISTSSQPLQHHPSWLVFYIVCFSDHFVCVSPGCSLEQCCPMELSAIRGMSVSVLLDIMITSRMRSPSTCSVVSVD